MLPPRPRPPARSEAKAHRPCSAAFSFSNYLCDARVPRTAYYTFHRSLKLLSIALSFKWLKVIFNVKIKFGQIQVKMIYSNYF